jgi:hypothetical protein
MIITPPLIEIGSKYSSHGTPVCGGVGEVGEVVEVGVVGAVEEVVVTSSTHSRYTEWMKTSSQ